MKKSEIIRLAAFVFVFVLLIGLCPVFSEGYDKFSLMIDDTPLNKEITTSTLEGITYVPLSRISSSLGINVKQEADIITISRQKARLMLKLQQDKAFLEENGFRSNSYAYIKENIIYVPIIYLADYLKFDVEVLYELKSIRIKTKPGVLLAGQIYNSALGTEQVAKQPAKAAGTAMGPKVAYLTFDDGLDNKVTPQILDILKQYKVKGAFFIVGNTVSKHKDVLKRINDEGHSIGNHSYSHKKDIIYTSVEKFSEELAKTSKAIYEVTGIAPKLFRPPYGSPYIKSREYKEALADYNTVLWNVDSNDSRVKGINASGIAASVKNQLKGKQKAIILFHSTSAKAETVKALPEIIQYLIDNGYTIASLE